MPLLKSVFSRSEDLKATVPSGLSSATMLPIEHPRLQELHREISKVIRGKDDIISKLLVSVVAGGSVLLEDLPGVGKTTLAKAFSKLVDLEFKRLQCTSDLLPADVYGFSVFNSKEGEFSFRPGPVFCNLLLVDEINRASPRTQSALLEAMAEGQVSIEGESRILLKPFFVIATQNPAGFQGTYPLPEAQLDRFLFHMGMDYPDHESEVDLLYDQNNASLNELKPIMSADELQRFQEEALQVEVHRDLADYVIRIVEATRQHDQVSIGVSPRGAKMLFRAAQSAAMVGGRKHVLPDDIQNLAGPTLAHRLSIRGQRETPIGLKQELIEEVMRSIPVPA